MNHTPKDVPSSHEKAQPPIIFVDSHAHLELEPLAEDVLGVLKRAESACVMAIVTVGIDIDDVKKAIRIAEQFEQVFASVGFHPHNASLVGEDSLAAMEKFARHPKVVAYGEIGLDFFRNRSPRDIQIGVFKDQIALAKSLAKPLVIHLRDAYEEGLEMLEEAAPFPASGVIHCFSGTKGHAERALQLGFSISIPGTITYKKNDDLRSIVRRLPEDKMLLETDCPFLSPEPLRGTDNEPANIVHTARRIAEVRGQTIRDVAAATSENAIRLFRFPGLQIQMS